MPLHPHLQALAGVTITAGRLISRHFIVDPTLLVLAALHSVVLTNPSVELDAKNKIISLCEPQPSQVSIVSGGGSGHEPSFAFLVGRGLLTAAVTGTILASPDAEQVRVAMMDKVRGESGIVAIIINNQGDVRNFSIAIAKAKASGLKVELVIVGDDVGRGRIDTRTHGRSGIAGTILVLKIAGALAASGASLEDVSRIARLTAENLQSVGVSLSPTLLENHPLFDPQVDEYLATEQTGSADSMGIRLAPGSHNAHVDLPEIVNNILKQLLDWRDEDRSFSEQDATTELILLINNLGGLSRLELGGITMEVSLQLQKNYGIRPVRVFSGTYMSSLNELGFSVSLLKVVDFNLQNGKQMLELLDAPAEVTGWSGAITTGTWESSRHVDP